MKPKTAILVLLTTFLVVTHVLGQMPSGFNYQSIIRDSSGEPVVNQEVSLDILILEGGPDGDAVFSETHLAHTNELGLINIQVGSISSLDSVNWSDGPYFMEVSVDGEVYSSSQLLSVPFALHAMVSADTFSGDYEDLENAPDMDGFIYVADPETGDMLYYSEGEWGKLSVGEDMQVLMVVDGYPQWVDFDDADENGSGNDVSDIDGNFYETIIIGEQEWMAENLRVTRYNNEDDIPTGLTGPEWSNATIGAYTVYPHNDVDGVHTAEDMIEAYGKLYNWYAVDDPRGLCPEGWVVPSDDDWEQLLNYVIDQGFPNNWNNPSGAGNAIKSCRQVNSPHGDECNTSDHPRWNAHGTHHGFDEFGFSALPAGYRLSNGTYNNIGSNVLWWSATEYSESHALYRAMLGGFGNFAGSNYHKRNGFSIRCIKATD